MMLSRLTKQTISKRTIIQLCNNHSYKQTLSHNVHNNDTATFKQKRNYHGTKYNNLGKKATDADMEYLSQHLQQMQEKHGEIIEPIETDDKETICTNYFHQPNHTQTFEDLLQIHREESKKILKEERQKHLKKISGNPKHGFPPKPLKFAHTMEAFEREFMEQNNEVNFWKIGGAHKRCGALGIKVGMIPVWDQWGERHSCTVLFLDRNLVIGHKTKEKHGYTSIRIAAGERKAKRVNKPQLMEYSKLDIGLENNPPYLVREFRVTHPDGMNLDIGTQIHASHFLVGQNVDVAAISKGKGFQGGMKRHNFKGMPASHGVSLSHRAIGSTGSCQDPGKVFKGKKMPGHMGCDRVTVQNLRIVKIDRGRNLLYIKGPIPGQKGNFVEIKDAVKKPLFGTKYVQDEMKLPPLPTFFDQDGIDGSGQAGYELFMNVPDNDPFSTAVSEEL